MENSKLSDSLPKGIRYEIQNLPPLIHPSQESLFGIEYHPGSVDSCLVGGLLK